MKRADKMINGVGDGSGYRNDPLGKIYAAAFSVLIFIIVSTGSWAMIKLINLENQLSVLRAKVESIHNIDIKK